MRDSWIEKYHHQQHSEEETRDAFNAFIELSESPDIHFDENKAWKQVSSRLDLHEGSKAEVLKRSGFLTVYKVAAVIALLIVSFVVYQLSTDNKPHFVTITTTENAINHELPDGSAVYLDSYSMITYDEGFTDRTLEFSGTGYYDVQKAGSSFTVKMGDLEVKVLGTVFTLESSASRLKTYVEEGEVQVSGSSELHRVNPGELLTFNSKRKEFTLTKNTDQNILSWKTGKFVFKNTSLPEVINNLERYYKVQFENQSDLSNCTVTAEFDKQDLSEVLTILGEILDLEFSNTGSIVKILGKGCH